MIAIRYALGDVADAVDAAVTDLADQGAMEAIFAKDPVLWGEGTPEVANRLGWVDIAERTLDEWDELVELGREISSWATQVVVLGMGGSSLFPEVLAATFGQQPGMPRLRVLDTTDPAAVQRVLDTTDPLTTCVVVSSKSGSTVETRSHFELFWERSGDPKHFIIVTDPDSGLAVDTRDRGITAVFENDPDIGGRFSALSFFGMVPAALAGIEGASMLESALDESDAVQPLGDDETHNTGLVFGATLGAAARAGRNKLTLVLDERIAAFGLWLEQLIAESTGKHGVGIVPVIGESTEEILESLSDRLVVTIGEVADRAALRDSRVPLVELSLEEPDDLGAQVLLWEIAIALAGRVLEINPFDQPDVESAKVAARAVLDGSSSDVVPAVVALDTALASVGPRDYVALCAFIDPFGEDAVRMEQVRRALDLRLKRPVTLGVGPRFLHSTGQLHKGGPDEVVVIQIVDPSPNDLAIPGQTFTFGTLIAAQADGDFAALAAAGKRVFRVAAAELLSVGD